LTTISELFDEKGLNAMVIDVFVGFPEKKPACGFELFEESSWDYEGFGV
jgi:hypothetical protein